MALDTYTALKASVADWLNRSDLTSQIPDFISLAEAEMKRRVRRSSTRTTLSIAAEAVTIPADLAELRSMTLVSGTPSRDVPIRVGTPEMVAERKARNGGVTGRPTDVAVMAGQFIFAPAPDTTYSASIFYFTQLTALGASQATNAILAEAPDAYLFGTLFQAAPFLEHDERAGVWKAKFDAAIEQLNDVRDREEHNASLQAIRLPVVFG